MLPSGRSEDPTPARKKGSPEAAETANKKSPRPRQPLLPTTARPSVASPLPAPARVPTSRPRGEAGRRRLRSPQDYLATRSRLCLPSLLLCSRSGYSGCRIRRCRRLLSAAELQRGGREKGRGREEGGTWTPSPVQQEAATPGKPTPLALALCFKKYNLSPSPFPPTPPTGDRYGLAARALAGPA
ncbi:hypothetical protein P7K49_024426 [Saguinus oedipus]|uniref:Uncharacterized protein n=1 Tax=Saguinus oedipus TaxID=9490 RepID=A0ABQ9UPG5_SAGOE|nr:hypothetical protein P7K49_024426 [Saguinus oedipus]